MKKLPCEKTDEEIVAVADAHYEKWKTDMNNKKKPKPMEPFFSVTAEDKAKAAALNIQLHQPIALTPDYNRSITKSGEAKKYPKPQIMLTYHFSFHCGTKDNTYYYTSS
jgi:hypothetical protein